VYKVVVYYKNYKCLCK